MVDDNNNTLLREVSCYGYVKALNVLLDCSYEHINDRNSAGNTALIGASIGGHKECVKMLLYHNADVNIQIEDGNTALMLALMKGHEEWVKMLLDHNANVNIQNKDGNTALMLALMNGVIGNS